ncbi:MAG TPA: DUF4097 family beta strand repeat-containing protein [Vicinamibacterales bacterium]|jgi:hypothetical protein
MPRASRLSVVSALAAALLLAVPAAARADNTERVDRTIPFQNGGTLQLKTFSGRVTISATDQPQVVIHAVRHGTQAQLDAIKLDIQESGSRIIIDANKKTGTSWFWRHNDVVETEFDIQVPANTDLAIETFSSPVDVTGVAGAETVKGFSSPITLAGVTGPVEAHTFSGDITVRSSKWTSGQPLDAATFSGDITLEVPATTQADVEFKTFSGDMHSDIPLVFEEQRHGTMRAQFKSGGGHGSESDFHLHTFSGDVRIKQ